MTLSVVVPIYNSEKYLAECLGSLITQKSINEIICVNDGSKDGSKKIIEAYKKKDSRIVIINKENTGYGDSVNKGIEFAKGEYIGIVESDDTAVPEAFSHLMKIAERTNVDFVKGNYNLLDTFDKKIEFHENLSGVTYDKISYFQENYNILYCAPAVWSAIYKKQFLYDKKIRFLPTPGASYQDTSFAFKTWILSNSFYLINIPVINYRVDSIGSSSNIKKNVFNIFYETEEMLKYLRKSELKHLFPAFIKLKYKYYIWNFRRFDDNDKIKFLLKWYPEIVDDFYAGYLEKKYWNDDEWLFIHNIIFNFDNLINNIESRKIDNSYYLKQTSPVYIYGAGKYGLMKKQELNSLEITVTAFIVSNKDNNPETVEGIPVLSLSQINRDGVIFIGVSDKYKSEVIATLKDKWLINNVFEI